jgi:predicted dithiol-disulfide oxidoreductase (DUF899 family)
MIRRACHALTTYALLEMTPKGRNEKNNLTDWVKLHDRYEAANNAGCCHAPGAS